MVDLSKLNDNLTNLKKDFVEKKDLKVLEENITEITKQLLDLASKNDVIKLKILLGQCAIAMGRYTEYKAFKDRPHIKELKKLIMEVEEILK